MAISEGSCGIAHARQLGDLLQSVTARLRDAGVDNARLDARLLIAEAVRVSAEDILLHPERTIAEAEAAALETLVVRRVSREPMSHILGIKGFWDFDLAVSADVLTPRPETELLVDVAIRHFASTGSEPETVLDLGTGSGCIVLSVLDVFPTAKGHAVDLSDAALKQARDNAGALDLADRMKFYQGRWFSALGNTSVQFDLIVSNPPYIPTSDIKSLAPEVRDYEPHLALDGGADGLVAYRDILADVAGYLKPRGLLVFEVGVGQAEAVSQLCCDSGFDHVETFDDLAGIGRVVSAQRDCG